MYKAGGRDAGRHVCPPKSPIEGGSAAGDDLFSHNFPSAFSTPRESSQPNRYPNLVFLEGFFSRFYMSIRGSLQANIGGLGGWKSMEV